MYTAQVYQKGQICLVHFEKGVMVAGIVSIANEKLAVKVISKKNIIKINQDTSVDVQVEAKDGSSIVTHYQAKVISIHSFVDQQLLFLYIYQGNSFRNKRSSTRIRLASYLENSVKLDFRLSSPDDESWHKATVIDISIGGIQIAYSHGLHMGQNIEVLLGEPFLNNAELVASKIVNVNEREDLFYYSIQFINLSESQKSSLNERLSEFQKI